MRKSIALDLYASSGLNILGLHGKRWKRCLIWFIEKVHLTMSLPKTKKRTTRKYLLWWNWTICSRHINHSFVTKILWHWEDMSTTQLKSKVLTCSKACSRIHWRALMLEKHVDELTPQRCPTQTTQYVEFLRTPQKLNPHTLLFVQCLHT